MFWCFYLLSYLYLLFALRLHRCSIVSSQYNLMFMIWTNWFFKQQCWHHKFNFIEVSLNFALTRSFVAFKWNKWLCILHFVFEYNPCNKPIESKGGGSRISQRGRQTLGVANLLLAQFFPENCMKMKEICSQINWSTCPSNDIPCKHYWIRHLEVYYYKSWLQHCSCLHDWASFQVTCSFSREHESFPDLQLITLFQFDFNLWCGLGSMCQICIYWPIILTYCKMTFEQMHKYEWNCLDCNA